MIRLKLSKVIVGIVMVGAFLGINQIEANAAWKQNSSGWWYESGSSWLIGWAEIDGKWYYFKPDGYMAHDTTIEGFKLGSDGAWVIDTSSVSIATSNEELVEVTVGTAEEFVKAIGSNKRIILKPGVYNLSEVEQTNNADNSVVWQDVYDGKELNIQNIHNMTIEGMDSGKVEIKVSPRYANIMNFTNVSNITIKNIVAGHTPAPYECNAGVLQFNESADISIVNSELYGCGSIGISLNNVMRLNASNCLIDHCSLRAIQIYNSEAISFAESKIVNHEAYSNIVMVYGSKDVTFEKCEISDNKHFGWSFIEATNNSNILLNQCIIKNNTKSIESEYNLEKISFFNTVDYNGISDSKIIIKNSVISNNKCDYLLDNAKNVQFENCTISYNVWK